MRPVGNREESESMNLPALAVTLNLNRWAIEQEKTVRVGGQWDTTSKLYLEVNLDTRQKHAEAKRWKNIYYATSKHKQTGIIILMSRQTDLKAKC